MGVIMSKSKLVRRVVIAALGAMALTAIAPSPGALARRIPSPGGVRVDVAPLAANAGEPTAEWVAEALPGQIARNLAARGVSANVSVQVDYLTLGSNVGANGPAGSSYDNIQGSRHHQRRGDAGAGDLVLLSHGERPDDDRTIEPRTGAAAHPGARLLDRPGRSPLRAVSARRRAPGRSRPAGAQAALAIAWQTSPTSASTSA